MQDRMQFSINLTKTKQTALVLMGWEVSRRVSPGGWVWLLPTPLKQNTNADQHKTVSAHLINVVAQSMV